MVARKFESIILIGALLAFVGAVPETRAQTVGPSGHWGEETREAAAGAVEPGWRAAGVDQGLGGTNEPVIAVNPLNPLSIAMSSLFASRVSTNGGVSWTSALANAVPAGYSRDGDPCMAYDSTGRLFYVYQGRHIATGGADEFISEMNPTTGARIAGPVKISLSGSTGAYNDKPWLAADRWTGSPFVDRLYVVWSEFPLTGNVRVRFSYSTDHGATWSTALQLSSPTDGGFPWPSHIAVAPNGDVYVSYHDGFANGSTGRVWVRRSTDGGVSFTQKVLAYTAGTADVTYNVQDQAGTIPGTDFWLQGSGQAWLLPDPHISGNIYLVANDDPDNAHGTGDDANVYIRRSEDNGLTWSASIRVDHDAGSNFAVMPTAAIDDTTGCIVVMWYDNRLGGTNGNGNYLLNVFYTVSSDRGLTFRPDVQLNDAAIDPDLGAPQRFPGPPPTLRIGEYICIAFGSGTAYGVWMGNTMFGQQTIFDSALDLCPDCNNNGVLDATDISAGTSLDCDADVIPDECEYPGCAGILIADMNCDGLRDGGDVAGFVEYVAAQQYTCEADANQDGAVDLLDVSGFSLAVLTGP